jgi:hypothetical protein
MRRRLAFTGLALLAAGVVLVLAVSPGAGLAAIAVAALLLAAAHPLLAERAASRAAPRNGRPYSAAAEDLDLPPRGRNH